MSKLIQDAIAQKRATFITFLTTHGYCFKNDPLLTQMTLTELEKECWDINEKISDRTIKKWKRY